MKHDLIIVGSGPSGLSAAINAASEGLSVVVLEAKMQLGGQAGTSTLIENYLGFSEGVSGARLTEIAAAQAHKFGVEFLAPFLAINLKQTGKCWTITSDEGDRIEAKAVLVTAGISYKALHAKNIARFIGCGVSYGSPSLSEDYSGKTVSIIGGANSAGQAALHLAKCKQCNINLIVRGEGLEDKMSTYLIDRINKAENIKLLTYTTVDEAVGHETLEEIIVCQSKPNNSNLSILHEKTDKLFILIGAKPKTMWLKDCLQLDENGFILTGYEATDIRTDILNFETSAKGIFAAGDVRADSVKRVAAAIGEGSMAINDIHKYLSSNKFD